MPSYTLYPCHLDGSSTPSLTLDVQDDDQAFHRAARLLNEHPTCSHVVIWEGGRKVGLQARPRESLTQMP